MVISVWAPDSVATLSAAEGECSQQLDKEVHCLFTGNVLES